MNEPSLKHTILPEACIGAFFDVDNTLLPGPPVEARFFWHLWTRGVIGGPEAARSFLCLLRDGPPWSLEPLRRQKPYLMGKPPHSVEPLAQRFIHSRVVPRLSPRGLATIREHQDAGHRVALITGALDFLMHPLAEHLRVTEVLAAIPERMPDRYTGRILTPIPYGVGKRCLMLRFAQLHGLDLRKSYAYGDSPGDVEALQVVGYPLVVNPIRGMARIARRSGWPVAKWA